MKLRIGVTGGIGSGKSLVTSLFRLHAIPVYDADAEARRIMDTDEQLQSAIRNAFGNEVVTEKSINRRLLASLVFNDENRLGILNNLVHPFVKRDFEIWEGKQTAPYTIREAAILFETGLWKDLDHTILVDAPEELRLRRVMLRDNRSEAEIKNIFSRQWSSEKKRELAWRIIENDELHLVIPQVNAIHNELMYA